MRLAKHLAHAGVASRRASEQLIFGGRVSVDGERIGGTPIVRVVYALYKPHGVVSTAADTHGRPTVVDLVRTPGDRRLYPVGRLDADSTGLILLTDDGDLAHKLTHPSFGVPKTYRVTVGGPPLRDGVIKRLRDGVELEDGKTAPAEARRISGRELELTIHEGRKRQVRRMCDVVGQPVRELRRIGFGPLSLGNLKEGQSRRLTPGEIEVLRGAAEEERLP